MCLNQAWIPFILGALEPLALPEYWETLGPIAGVDQLIGLLAGPPSEDCAAEPPATFSCDITFSTGTHGWTVWEGYGSYLGSFGWHSITVSSPCSQGEAFSVIIQTDFGVSVEITKVIVRGEVAMGSTGRHIALFDDPAGSNFSGVDDPGLGPFEWIWEGTHTTDTLAVDVDGCGPGPGAIYEILIYGNGSSPCS